MARDWRTWTILGVTLAASGAAWFLPRVPQDPGYHEFADARAFLGLAHFANVISNLAFVIVGALGLKEYTLSKRAGLHPSYVVYCAAVIGVGVGSAFYHADPTTATLMWDRLPMTVAFMAFFAMVIGDRISAALGRSALWPLVVVGVGSVVYWHITERFGVGDLRPYGLVQFLPILLVAILLSCYEPRHLRTGYLWGSLGLYGVAKLAEYLDAWVYDLSAVVSGHTLKHLLAAGAVLLAMKSLRRPPP